NLIGFAIYVGVCVLASGFKLRLPGVTGTVSAGFFPVLIGIVCLETPEALIGACAAVIIPFAWHAKKAAGVKVLFNGSSVAIAVSSSAAVFHSPWLDRLNCETAVRLAVLGGVYFIANTLPVAGVIALTERKSIWNVWQGSCFWSFPH